MSSELSLCTCNGLKQRTSHQINVLNMFPWSTTIHANMTSKLIIWNRKSKNQKSEIKPDPPRQWYFWDIPTFTVAEADQALFFNSNFRVSDFDSGILFSSNPCLAYQSFCGRLFTRPLYALPVVCQLWAWLFPLAFCLRFSSLLMYAFLCEGLVCDSPASMIYFWMPFDMVADFPTKYKPPR